MKTVLKITLALVASASLVSCFSKDKPNYQFMPNMYEPVGYETYGEYAIFEDEQEAMLPVEGTIPRGWKPYDYENTTEGLELARAELKNPLPLTQDNLSEGAQLYTIYCAVCHGEKGDGQGILAQREKFLGIPSYADPGRNVTPGSTYHVQMYGLNMMGSYASQTDEEERWQIAHHVMDLKNKLNGGPGLQPIDADSTMADNVNVVDDEDTIGGDDEMQADTTNEGANTAAGLEEGDDN